MRALFIFLSILLNILPFAINMIAQPTLEGGTTPTMPPNPGGPNLQCDGTERRVFWVHGLGGDATVTWQKAGAHMQSNFCIRSMFPIYSPTGLQAAGQNVRNTILNLPPDDNPKAPFIIAHSQGGLVARSVLYELNGFNPNALGGVVTFGSPHLGAKILDNIPDLLQLLKEGCQELSAGPFTSFVESNFFLDLFLRSHEIFNNLSPVLCNTAIGIVETQMSDFQSNISKDYRFNSPSEYFNILKEFQSPQVKVSFYGIEQEPEVFRLMYWLANSCENVPDFTANEDQEFIGIANATIAEYESQANSWKQKATYYGNRAEELIAGSLLIPVGAVGRQVEARYYLKQAKDAEETGKNWKRGADWLKSLNEKWQVIIGSRDYVREEEKICFCEEYDIDGRKYYEHHYPYTSDLECYEIQQQSPFTTCWVLEKVEYTLQYIEPSDGVVPVSSAKNFPGYHYTDVLPGSNHQQMRNDMNTGEKLYALFEDPNIYGRFFNTPRR